MLHNANITSHSTSTTMGPYSRPITIAPVTAAPSPGTYPIQSNLATYQPAPYAVRPVSASNVTPSSGPSINADDFLCSVEPPFNCLVPIRIF